MSWKKLLIVSSLLVSTLFCRAQIEIAHATVKKFTATGFGVFINVSMHLSDANYATLDGGLQYFVNRYSEDLGMIPVVLGYRYTINHTGAGVYIEPNAGYNFGSSTIEKVDANGSPVSNSNGTNAHEKVSGAVVGGAVGYLFQPVGKVQFNLGLRYLHTFGDAPSNVFGIRITHAFNFGRKEPD